MRILAFLLRKEFKQIFRNRALLPMIFIMPLVQLLVMPLAADYEIKNINISIVDHDRSEKSREILERIIASGYFQLQDYDNSFDHSLRNLEKDRTDLILEIPKHFEKDLLTRRKSDLFLAVNAINGTKANLGAAYVSQIIGQYQKEIGIELSGMPKEDLSKQISVYSANWYNTLQNYNLFMVPGILVVLVTMVGAYMCALNIVKEKEIGTIEQINVSPIKKYHFILGKMIPFWIIGQVVFSIGLFVVGNLIYDIHIEGSIWELYGFLSLYLVALLGLGLLISTYSETQQQAMSIAFFFMMIFLLMSGLFTAIESMPTWSQVIAYSNPVTYFIDVIRMLILKGSGFSDFTRQFIIVLFFALFFNVWAILNYRKTS